MKVAWHGRQWKCRIRRHLVPLSLCLLAAGCTPLKEFVHNGFKVGPNYERPPAPLATEWIDARNPRTQQRELPRGAMRRGEAWAIVAIAGVLYLASAAAIAPICLWLSPIPVVLFILYPYLKRWTVFAHLGLGLTWSMAPLGGWLAASESLEGLGEIGWLWLFSVLWVTGFDIIYATMDEAFDRSEGLRSLPARFGKRTALRVAAVVHAAAYVTLLALWWTQWQSAGSLWFLAWIAALFIWQHVVAERRPEFAFFQLNGVLGFLVLGLVLSGV